MHTVLTFCCVTFSFALGKPVYVNNQYNAIPIQGSNGGYVYGVDSHEEQEQAPVVQKHIYVHIPPPEDDYAPPQKVIPPPPPKIHYKIVFIKVPSPATPPPPVVPAPQPDQEKTLIYVLHKQPVETAPIVIPTPEPTAPAKPEVYFIRYKTQKELVPAQNSYDTSTPGPHRKYIRRHRGSTAISIISHPSSTLSPTSAHKSNFIIKMPTYHWGYTRTPYSPKADLVGAYRKANWKKLLETPSIKLRLIDEQRSQEVDNFYRLCQMHRDQYQDHTGRLHPLCFFQDFDHGRNAPTLTKRYLEYPTRFVEYKKPLVMPKTYARSVTLPTLPQRSLVGRYSPGSDNLYNR